MRRGAHIQIPDVTGFNFSYRTRSVFEKRFTEGTPSSIVALPMGRSARRVFEKMRANVLFASDVLRCQYVPYVEEVLVNLFEITGSVTTTGFNFGGEVIVGVISSRGTDSFV